LKLGTNVGYKTGSINCIGRPHNYEIKMIEGNWGLNPKEDSRFLFPLMCGYNILMAFVMYCNPSSAGLSAAVFDFVCKTVNNSTSCRTGSSRVAEIAVTLHSNFTAI
jgi:hypothetical protein